MLHAHRWFGIGFLLCSLLADAAAQSPYSRGGRGGMRQSTNPGANDPSKGVLPSFGGTLREVDSKSFTLEMPEGNTLVFHLSKKTTFSDGSKKIKAADLKPGDMVVVEGRRAPDGSLDAIGVSLSAKR